MNSLPLDGVICVPRFEVKAYVTRGATNILRTPSDGPVLDRKLMRAMTDDTQIPEYPVESTSTILKRMLGPVIGIV